MTDTVLDYDPNDTGEILHIPGEERTRIDTGEKTQRIHPALILAPSFRAIPSGDLTAEFAVYVPGENVGFDGPQAPPPPLPPIPDDQGVAQPIAPLERVAGAPDTERLTILGALGGTPDPATFVKPLRPARPPRGERAPFKAGRVFRRGRHAPVFDWATFRFGALVGGGVVLTVYSGLIWAALVVVR